MRNITLQLDIERLLSIALLALLVVACAALLRPFLAGLLWALVLAVSTWPVFISLERRLGGRTVLAASLLTLTFALMFLLPLGFVGLRLAEEIPRGFEILRSALQDGPLPTPNWLIEVPWLGDELVQWWAQYVQDLPAAARGLLPYARQLADALLFAVSHLGQVLGQILLSLFVLFFFYRDGRPVAERLARVAQRLDGARGMRLLRVAGSAMRSVVYGVLGAAFAQGVMCVLGLALIQVKGWLFLGMLAGLLALIPLGLYMLIMLPTAFWLLMQGATWSGVFLLLWTLGVVGNVDNVLRPWLISRGARLPLPIVLLGVLGGLFSMGLIGLFVGATLLAVLYTLVREWSAAADAPPPSEIEDA